MSLVDLKKRFAMKRILALLLVVCSILSNSVVAGDKKGDVSKFAKKEAKQYKKAGWKILSDYSCFESPMEEQLELGYYYDISGDYTYAIGLSGLCDNMNEALDIAQVSAEQQLSENICTTIIARIESSLINKGYNNGQVETFTRTLATSISIVMEQNIKSIKVLGIYRETKDGKFEVSIGLACKYDDVLESVKEDLSKKDARNQEYISLF